MAQHIIQPKLLDNTGVQAQIKQIRAAKLHELSWESPMMDV